MTLYNQFIKKANSKTAFALMKGDAIFGKSVYMLNPIYIHKGSPSFTLVYKGKHISGFYRLVDNFYSGDYKGDSLLVHLNGNCLDLFVLKLNPVQLSEKFLSGQLNEELFKARQRV